MYSRLDDIITLAGIIILSTGLYLWLGLPITLVVLGLGLIFIGVRVDFTPPEKAGNNEPG